MISRPVILSLLAISVGNLQTPATADEPDADPPLQELYATGWDALVRGDAEGSLAAYDEMVRRRPSIEPGLWQRGIALYYAGRYEDAAGMFARHSTVNQNDVEVPVWHLLSLSRVEGRGLVKARESMLPVGDDARIPFRQIADLFAGTGSEEAVLDATKASGSITSQMYADLYLGLFAEAEGREDDAIRHVRKAAAAPLPNNSMRQIAEAHLIYRDASAE